MNPFVPEKCTRLVLHALLLLLSTALPTGAENAASSPIAGWRGDGTGRFPDANPPDRWSRLATSLQHLRSQAGKPADGQTGEPIGDGVIREWLVLGPVPWDADEQPWDESLLPDEANLAPDEHQKVGALPWKKYSTDTACVDFCAALGMRKKTQAVAYAHTYIYCDADEDYRLYYPASGACKLKLYVNGKVPGGGVGSGGTLHLNKGWNRLLARASCAIPYAGERNNEAIWNFRLLLRGGKNAQYEQHNIRWATPLPGWSIAAPVIVGDQIFTVAEDRTLCCLDKNDGRILWSHTTTLADAATLEQRQAHPEVFQEIDPLLARLAAIDAAPSAVEAQVKEKRKLEKQINGLMWGVDKVRFNGIYSTGDPGASVFTPCTDGRFVYVNFQPCIAACFDLAGNRQWTYVHPVMANGEHGHSSSPLLIEGKLLLHADQLVAVDAATGQPAWMMSREYNSDDADLPKTEKTYLWHWGYLYWSSLVRTRVAGQALAVTPVNVVRPSDGHILAAMPEFAGNFTTTPIVDSRRIYRLGTKKGDNGLSYLDVYELPVKVSEPFELKRLARIDIDVSGYSRTMDARYLSSPVYHEGLVYCMNSDGVLSVVDVEQKQVVYQKLLDLDWMIVNGPGRCGVGSSLTLAGKYIYAFGNQGTCLVIRPGRQYDPVAKNVIEQISSLEASPSRGRLEQMISCPVAEGTRLYVRQTDRLYCLETDAASVPAGSRTK
ncbi:MAG TPA: PQQ-binding-like beta-propeller repeat protein [Chthoniobacteraceae bacterium]|jgi:outer membrane protein assembly factor BamB|nr:PQQ-binding-like beta-propeller repeat protein [Chthoniobacteraceae bacterium]